MVGYCESLSLPSPEWQNVSYLEISTLFKSFPVQGYLYREGVFTALVVVRQQTKTEQQSKSVGTSPYLTTNPSPVSGFYRPQLQVRLLNGQCQNVTFSVKLKTQFTVQFR